MGQQNVRVVGDMGCERIYNEKKVKFYFTFPRGKGLGVETCRSTSPGGVRALSFYWLMGQL